MSTRQPRPYDFRLHHLIWFVVRLGWIRNLRLEYHSECQQPHYRYWHDSVGRQCYPTLVAGPPTEPLYRHLHPLNRLQGKYHIHLGHHLLVIPVDDRAVYVHQLDGWTQSPLRRESALLPLEWLLRAKKIVGDKMCMMTITNQRKWSPLTDSWWKSVSINQQTTLCLLYSRARWHNSADPP